MSTITTPRAPSLAKDTAIALPRPRAPPVIKATPGATTPDRFAEGYDVVRKPYISNKLEVGVLTFRESPMFMNECCYAEFIKFWQSESRK
jgi:hypothetical protein